MALTSNLLPVHFNDGGGRSYVQPLPASTEDPVTAPNVSNAGSNVNSTDQEMTQSAEEWLNSYFQGMDKGLLIALGSANGDGKASLWSRIMSEGIQQGALSAKDVQSLTSKFGMTYTPEFEKLLNNIQAQENAKTEYDREIAARDTSITSTLNQLRDNQMSTGLLSSLGGASAGISTSAATSDTSNISQARKMAEFNRKTTMAKTMLGVLTGMASAGIYGGSMFAGRKAVAKLTTDASLAAVKANNATKLLTRRKGRSRFDGNGNFLYHESFDY